MKKLRVMLCLLYLLCISAYPISAFASEPKPVRWLADGQVINSDGQRQQLAMQNIDKGFLYTDKTYVMGFRINSAGINAPIVAEVSADFIAVKYWPFATTLQGFFIYRDALYINDAEGNLFSLANGDWNKSDLKFPKDAVVVHYTHNELVICYRASPLKQTTTQGGCYALDSKWHYPFFWYAIEPKVCDGNLHIVEENAKRTIFRKLSVKTGEILASAALKDKPKDLCKIPI